MSVGLYVPGGTAAYPSSVLMNIVPAKVGGRRAHRHGRADAGRRAQPAGHAGGRDRRRRRDLAHRRRAGGGGAGLRHATIAPVDKIVGPGNAYVAAAKRRVFGQVGIDLIAGPSEILVVADAQNDPAWIAADLLSQAEHDAAAQSILITDDAAFADAVGARRRQRAARRCRAPRSRARAGATMARSSWCPSSRRARRSSIASPPSMSSSRWRRRRPRRWPTGSAMPARSSSAATRPRRSATMSPAPTTCCRPRARRASRAGSASPISSSAPRWSPARPTRWRRSAPAALALAEAEGLGAHGRSVSIRLNRRG